MTDTVRIRRQSDGAEFEGPAGTEIPLGFDIVGGNVSTTTDSSGLMGSLYDSLRSLGRGYEEFIAPPMTQAVQGGLESLPFSQDPGTRAAIGGMSQFIVPQTATGAGIALGSLASGGLPLASRLIGAAAGGFLGGGLEGAPNVGAVEGLGAGLVGEAAAYPFSAGLRALRQGATDVKNVGRAVGEISPTLGRQVDAVGLQDRLKGRSGAKALSEEYAGTREAVGTAMAGQPGFGPAQSGFPAPLSSNSVSAPVGGALDQLTGKVAMTFEEAASAIESLRAGRHPLTTHLTGSAKGATERSLKAKAVEELTTALNYHDPLLGTLFRDAESAYGQGYELLRLFRTKGVLDPATGGLNMANLQRLAGEKQAVLEAMLGPAGWATLERAVYRGGSPPGMDQPRRIPSIFTLPDIKLPTSYVGEALSVPSSPFVTGAVNALDEFQRSRRTVPVTLGRNPFQR